MVSMGKTSPKIPKRGRRLQWCLTAAALIFIIGFIGNLLKEAPAPLTTQTLMVAAASPVRSPTPSSPPQYYSASEHYYSSSLAAYIESQLNAMTSDGRLKLKGDIYTKPIEIEVDRLEFRGGKIRSVRVRAYYKDIVFGLQSEEITRAIVQITLNWLISQGFNPHRDWIFVSAYGYYRETGATGQKLLRTWGSSFYDWNTDSIKWQAARG